MSYKPYLFQTTSDGKPSPKQNPPPARGFPYLIRLTGLFS